MSKYTIEGNVNFQDELFKMLNEDSDDEDADNLCQITGLPLTDKHVTLECNHRFNYVSLYNEIYKQKYVFKTYNPNTFTKEEMDVFLKCKPDYFIKCPYCRNIQFSILPYYKELELKKIWGINSDSKSSDEKSCYELWLGCHSFTMYGATFMPGKCCTTSYNCLQKYVAHIPTTQLTYCQSHYKYELKCVNMGIKLALQKEKEKEKEKKKQAKIDANNEKIKLLEEKNAERLVQGLPPLKRLPSVKIDAVNEVSCKALLKSGSNKGKPCSCKKIFENELCVRHFNALNKI